MTDKDYDKLKQIEEAIQAFNSKKLYESSLALYKALDYTSNKTERISPTNFDGFIDSFNLSKNAINKDKAFVSHWKHIEFIFQVADSEITRVQSLFDTGEVDRNEYQSFLFFTIQLKEESYKRSDLVKITRELNVPFKMPVIVLFQYGNKLTLSIIDRRLHKKDTSKDVLEKVTLIKDIDITNPQRAHKEILKDLSLNELYKKFEFHSFVKLHEAWKATLNISELNKKFYKELAYWYFWALQEVEFPDDELKDDKTRNPVNVIRLITRLIFVWFLKEKNLIPDDLFNKRELDKILNYKDKTGSTYYKAILQNLFFATLNTEMNKDVKDKNKISRTFVNRNTGVPHYFRYSRFIKDQDKFAKWMDNIPFLNGGLFECLDKRTKDKSIYIDGFSQQVKNETLVTVPDDLFFGNPRVVDLNSTFHTKGKKYEVQGLINILSRYKFTIEENTPVEEEVALDPELLGKVFENLLASYNEETETTARKLTGSFYTPREIVNYMVDESLITYLCNSLLKEDDEKKREELNTRLHHLFSYIAEEPQFTDTEKKDLIDAIDTCKILDPACGSGAFPMGILHKLVFILGKLDPNNKRWKQKQQDKAKRDKALAEKMEDDKTRDGTLKEIDKRIEDIEKAFNQNNHELDFARKLYLIENCIYGVDKQPVAIQISKLRFFIALIVDQKTENDSEPNRGIRPLPNLETKFVAADTLVSIEKPVQLTLMNQNEELQKEIREKEADIHRIREKHFRARTPDTKEKYRLLDAQHRDELALLLERDGFPKAATKQLAGWNPYDQNKFADFFDPMWMFEIEQGFDIVIGNPPYVSYYSNTGSELGKNEREFLVRIYDGVKKTNDRINTMNLFIERGNKLLKQGGVLSYIVNKTFAVLPSYVEPRKYFLDNARIEYLITNLDPFDAIVDCVVFGSIRQKPKINYKLKWYKGNLEDYSVKSSEQFFKNSKLELHFSDNHFAVTKIEKASSKLSELITVNRGVNIGGCFEHFLSQDRINKDYHKYLSGTRAIKRYSYKWEKEKDGYFIFDLKLEQKLRAKGATLVLGDPNRYLVPRLFIPESGQYLMAAYCDEKMYSAYGLMVGTTTAEDEDLKYPCALLNSKLFTFYATEKEILRKGNKATPHVGVKGLNSIPVNRIKSTTKNIFIKLVDYVTVAGSTIGSTNELDNYEDLCKTIDGCVYELYFGEEMKKAGVDILALVEKDLEAVKKLSPEKAIAKLYEKWQEPKNEVRNRLLLMSTRCPDTIGVIEASVS